MVRDNAEVARDDDSSSAEIRTNISFMAARKSLGILLSLWKRKRD